MNIHDNYIETEISWLKKIPSHWSTFRFIDNVNLRHGFQFRDDDFTDSGLKVIKISQLSPDGHLDLSNCSFISPDRLSSFRSILIKEGDILMALTGGTIGKIIRVGKVNEPLLQNYRVGNFYPKPSQLNKNFTYYLLASKITEEQINYLLNRNGQPNIGKESFKNMFFPQPSLEEQTSIAEYLDTKTLAIDKKVNLLEKKINYFQELRKSLINETVTKGLDKNSELHTNELGFATPKNWLRFRLKDLGSLYGGLSGKSGHDFNQDNNPDNKGFIPFTNIANNTYLKRDHLGTVVIYEGEKQNRVRKGDIFFLMSSEGYEDIGKSAALAEDIEETYLNSFCKGYRVNPCKTNPYFLNYLMLSDYYRQLLIVEGKGFTRINLKIEKVNDFLVYIPDTLSAQDEIVKFLDAKLDTISKITTNIQTQIAALKALRKTLINDVVTGKIKVTKE